MRISSGLGILRGARGKLTKLRELAAGVIELSRYRCSVVVLYVYLSRDHCGVRS